MKPHILIIEDDPDLAEGIRYNLDRTGAFTEVAQLSLPGFSSVISSSVALADFNSDGRPDILADNPENSFPGPQSLVLFLANPAAPGGYNPAVAVGASAHLAGRLTVTNLNPLDDVFPDIVSGTADGDDTFVAFGNGAGGFGTPVNVGGAGQQTNGLAADLNGDGFPDLILQEQINPGFRAAIAVRLNDGHGNFAAATIHDPAPLERLEKFAVGDFDGDGRPDVAVLGRINLGAGTYGDGLVLLRQNAVGAFAVSAVVSLDGSTAERSGVAVGDLTGDGLADVVIVAVEPATFVRRMKVFAGRANGTLRAGSVTVLPGNAYDLDLAEVNSDGRFDVIVSGQSGLQTYRTEPSFAALPVPSLLPAFMQWSFAHFGYAEADALGDPDGDGLATLLEYALNLRPDRADAAPFAVTRAASAYGERLRLFLQRDPAHRDVKIEVQAASQVTGPWTTIATSTLGAAFTGPGYVGGDSATPGLKTIEIRDTVDIASTPARFLRVKVTR